MMRVCIAGNSGHGLSILESPESLEQIEVVGYCRTYEGEKLTALREAFGDLHKDLPFYQDYRQMLDETKPDVVVVDGMFCDHAKLAIEALKRVSGRNEAGIGGRQGKDLRHAESAVSFLVLYGETTGG